ncbi:hypothetical protein ACFLVS_03290 [Chloroflexota bacterium]
MESQEPHQVETMPEGCYYVEDSTTAVSGIEGITTSVDGQVVTFSFLCNSGETAIQFIYKVDGQIFGNPVYYDGILIDQYLNQYAIGGDTETHYFDCAWDGDINGDGTFDIDDVLIAISDYFDGQITITDVLQLIALYFAG